MTSTARDPRLSRLAEIVRRRAVLHGDFTLSSGQKSSYYFDCRKVTHDPEGVTLVGELVYEALQGCGAEAVGGPATAANSIVTATQMTSYHRGKPLQAFYVRSEAKEHGTGKRIEGNLPAAGGKVALVEDAITSGGSLLGAIEAVEAEGCKVARVVVLVDRRQGGVDRLRAKGYDVHALLLADADRIL